MVSRSDMTKQFHFHFLSLSLKNRPIWGQHCPGCKHIIFDTASGLKGLVCRQHKVGSFRPIVQVNHLIQGIIKKEKQVWQTWPSQQTMVLY